MDDYPDIIFAGENRTDSAIALSDGQGGFTMTSAPPSAQGAHALQLIDYDNDGLLDLLSWTSDGVRLARNIGTPHGLTCQAQHSPPKRPFRL
ncbi:MAG: FG-GAP repeat domain-containing protein [Vicinamibacterales bacterium]